MARRLGRNFYAREGLTVARELLGKLLRRRTPQFDAVGRIVEVEAYLGLEDQASHARRGPTPRARIMFGPPGFAYVYLVYGMHHALNVVVDRAGHPAAILIRAVEPMRGIAERTDGPGRLCRAFQIDRGLDGEDLSRSRQLWLEDDGLPVSEIAASPRIGVGYAGEQWAAMPWRFTIPGSPHVSRVPKPRKK